MDVFTSLEFKKLLNEAETRGEALLKFVRASEKFDSHKKLNHDLVKSYISSSADCAELLQCLKGEVTPNDLSAVFRCLINILRRTASDLQEFYGKVGMSICDGILRNHLQKVYHALGLHQSPKTVSYGLKMLTLLVMQGKEAARDMAHQLDFNLRCFKDVMKRFKGRMSFEIRKSYIQFVISFFMSGDARTINRILDVRGFASAIFQGLDRDQASTIQMVLAAILDNGVKNLSVSKSSKARFFAEPKLLKNISRLFVWDGIFDITGVKGLKKSSGKHFIHNLVQNFLYHVCCPFDYGINFLDKELGIGEKCKNHVLLDFILHLSSLASEPLVRDLIVNILKACPDLLPRLMKDFRMTLDTKSEEIWLRNCELVRCVYESQPDIATGLSSLTRGGKSHSDEATKATDLDILVKMILPGVMSPNFSCLPVLKHCMKSKSLQVKEKCLNLLVIFMRKLDASITFMLDKSTWKNVGYTTEETEIFYAKFEDAILGTYLNIPFLIQLWKELSSGSDKSLKITLLKIIKTCQKLFPDDVLDAKYDFTRLLNTIAASSQLCENVDSLDVMIIDMLSENPQMYKWFKVFEKGNTPFKTLVNVVQNSLKTSDLYKKSSQLCEKVMLSSGIFQQHELGEASVWIENIVPDVRTHNNQIMVQYLNDVCSKVARMPMKYFDILSVEMEKNTSPPFDSEGNFWENLPTVEIEAAAEDDWASIVIQQSKFTSGAIDVGGDESRGTISLLMVAALDCLKEVSYMDEERTVLDNYLAQVCSHLLNHTRNAGDAEYFARIYEKCTSKIAQIDEKYPFLNNFGVFLTIWMKKHIVGPFNTSNESVCAQLQLWLWRIHKNEKPQDGVSAIVSSFLANDDCLSNKFLSLMSQCLLYFDTLRIANNFESSKEMLIVLIEMVHKMEKHKESINAENASKLEAEMITAQQWILQNPGIQTLFFQDIFLQSYQADDLTKPNLKKLVNSDVSLDSICTYAIAGLIMKKSSSLVSFTDRICITKIVDSIPKLLKHLPNGLNSDGMKTLFLPEVYNHIQDLLTAQDCNTIFYDVTEVLPTIQSKKVAKLSAKILSTAIRTICSRGMDFDPATDLHKGTSHIFNFLNSKLLKNQSDLILALSVLIQQFPSLAVHSDGVLVETILETIDDDRVELCAEIVRYNPELIKKILKNGFFYGLPQQDLLTAAPLAHQVLNTLVKDFESNTTKICKLFDLYWGILTSINQWKNWSVVLKCHDGKSFLHNLLSLCRKFGREDDVKKLLESLNDGEQFELEADEVLTIVQCIFSSLGKISCKSQINISSTLVILKMIMNSSSEGTLAFNLLKNISDSIHPSLHQDFAVRCCVKWSEFFKKSLKKYFDSTIAIQCITEFIKLLYPQDGAVYDTGIGIETLRGMLVSHSKFLPCIIMEKGIDHDSLKCSILKLHYEMVVRCSANDLSPTDFGYLLSAYNAALSKLDQIILKTLLVYEKKDVCLDDMKPFLWGKSAVSSYRARKNLGETLWKKPGCTEVLSCLDDSVMELTLKHFPVRRRMVFIQNNMADLVYFENDKTGTISSSKNIILEKSTPSHNVYDPCFLLPSFMHVLSPENLVDCKVFVRSGGLSYLMCCLASHCHAVRALAADCLVMYYHHAQTAWFSENNLTMYLIRCVRNSMPVKDDGQGNTVIAKLPSVVANFLAALVQLHLKPKDHMFSVLHRYLLIKPQLDLKDIPEFYVLFFSAEMESKIERTWVVNLICNSLRDQGDFNTINKRNVVQLLMSLHDSAVGDNFVRRQVFEVFERIVSIRSSAFDLVKNKGFISWLTLVASNQPTRENAYSRVTQTIGRPGRRRDDTKDIIRVVSTLCKTLDAGNIVCEKEKVEQNDENQLPSQISGGDVEKMDTDKVDMRVNAIAAQNERHTAGDTVVENMEVDRDSSNKNGITRNEKRVAVTPFRILNQIVSLVVTLQHNLLQNTDFDLDFCVEGLEVLSSCIIEMNTRNTRIVHKNSLKHSNHVFLNDDEVEIIYQTAMKMLKLPCHEEGNTICFVLTIFMAWQPERCSSLEMWKAIFKLVTDSKNIWTKNCNWVKNNMLQFCHWLKTCKSTNYQFESSDKQAFAMLYDVIFNHAENLQSRFSECLQSLNEIESGKNYESDVTLSKILKDANTIRRKLFME